jgi:small subunit ribosomal protein S21
VSDLGNDSNSSENSEKRKYNKPEGSYDNFSKDTDGREQQDYIPNAAMEVTVENNIEKAMKVLKRKLIKEGLFKELKARKYFEKPSERKKRKKKESVKKVRKDVLRSRKNSMLLS